MICGNAQTSAAPRGNPRSPPGPDRRQILPHRRQHHARSRSCRLRARPGALVRRQPADLLSVEAARAKRRRAHGHLCRQSRRLGPPQTLAGRGQSSRPRHSAISPGTSRAVVYVRDGDIFVYDNATGKTRQVTKTTRRRVQSALSPRRQTHLVHARQQSLRPLARRRRPRSDDRHPLRSRAPLPAPRRPREAAADGAAPPRPPPPDNPRAEPTVRSG